MEEIPALDEFIKGRKLKRCPFCGNFPVRFEDIRYPDDIDNPYYVYGIFCVNEQCIMHQREKYYKTEEAAEIAWNMRVQKSQ